MNYSKENFLRLIDFLKSKGAKKYEVLINFFESHIQRGHIDFGVSEPGTQGAAVFIEELKQMFPDVYYALFKMPVSEAPKYIGHETDQEYPIAVWLLQS